MERLDENSTKFKVQKLIEGMITRVFNGSVPETTLIPVVEEIDKLYKEGKENIT